MLGNVVLGLTAPDAEQRGRAALAEVGLAGRERAWPVELSGGEQQRVALARSLVREPGLLLADEPFGALDALTRIRMHTLLRRLCERHRPAVLLVTHDVDEAIVLADRVVVLDRGRIAADLPVGLPGSAPPRRRRVRGPAGATAGAAGRGPGGGGGRGMTERRQLRLNLFVYPGGHHEAACATPAPTPAASWTRLLPGAGPERRTRHGRRGLPADGPSLADNGRYARRFRTGAGHLAGRGSSRRPSGSA
ncbi:Vitamin B12 import ATP-binding protein BtuD [Streptomyces glaucescens]